MKNLFRRSRSKTNQKRSDLTEVRPSEINTETLEARMLFSAAPVDAAPDAEEANPDGGGEPQAVTESVVVTADGAQSAAAALETAESTQEGSVADQTRFASDGLTEVGAEQDVTLVDLNNAASLLNQETLEALSSAARERWINSGLTGEQIAALDAVDYRIADLESNRLGSFDNGMVTLDIDAAGLGWFADATPLTDEEFSINSGQLIAGIDSTAARQADLLTVLMHEQGHALGIGDSSLENGSGNIMQSTLPGGARWLPGVGQADGAIPGSIESVEYIVTQIDPNPAPGWWSDLAVGPQSFTAGAGNNRVLLVFAADGRSPSDEVFPSTGEDPWGSPALTNVTFNGSNMTFAGRAIYASPTSGGPGNQNSHNSLVEAWYMVLGSGAAVTGNIEVTGFSTDEEPTYNDRFITLLGGVVYDGVDQTTPIDGFMSTTNAPTGGSTSLTVASEAGDRVVDAIMVHTGSAEIPTGDTQTIVHDLHPDSSSSGNSDHLHTSTQDGAASVSMDWDWSGGNRSFAHLAFNLNSSGVPHYDFSVPTYSANEGDVTNSVNVTVLRSDETGIASTVDVVLTSGTAIAGTDFTAGPIPVSFAAGETSKVVSIQLLGETIVELDETFGLSFANFSDNGHAGDTNPTATFTILNDDSAVISVNAPSETEGTALGFSVTISNPVDVAVTADRVTQDGTATTTDSDYTALTSANVQLFAAGSTSAFSIPVSTTADSKVELDETLDLILSTLAAGGRDVTFSGGGATLSGTGTILNDDSATVSIGDTSATEGSDLMFPVTLTNPVDVDTVVSFSTADGTARVVDNDYTIPATLSVTITAGNTSGTIDVTTLDDAFYELTETMTVTLSSVAAGGRTVSLGAPATGTGTIFDDDDYTTEVSLSGTVLHVADVLDFMTDDTIQIYTSGTDLIITDPNHTVGTTLTSANARTPDIHTVIVDLTAISFNRMEVLPIAGADLVTVGTMAGFDAHTLIDSGDGFDSIVHNGGVSLTGGNGVDYISETIRMNGGSSIATATGAVDFQGNVGTNGIGNFAAVTLKGASITSASGNVNLTGQGGTTGHYNRGVLLDVDLLTATASTISTGGQVSINGTGGSGGVHGTGVTLVAGTVTSTVSGPINISGIGGAGTAFSEGIAIHKGSTVDAGSGNLTLTGTGGGTGIMNRGINASNSDIQSAGGNIELLGQGGGTTYGMGAQLAGVDVTTTGSGTVTLRGTGASGTQANSGLVLAGASTASTVNGAILIEGTANGTTLLNHGVQVAAGTQIGATGPGTVTVRGIAGPGTSNNVGVDLASGSALSVNGGDLTVEGTARGTVTSNNGVRIANSSLTSSGAGDISVEGSGPAGAIGAMNMGIEAVGGTINATGAGGITLNGTGGGGSSNGRGIKLATSTSVSTASGAIAITGVGGGTGLASVGVSVEDRSSVTAGSDGTVTLNGTGANGTLLNDGVLIYTGSSVNTFNGLLTIIGTGRGSLGMNNGIKLFNGTINSTGNGAVILNGSGSQTGTATFNAGINMTGGSINTVGGNLTINGNGGKGTSLNQGIRILNATVRSTGGGDLSLTGIALNPGTTGIYNTGVYLLSVTLDSTGPIGVTGTGGGGTALNHGIYMQNITTPNSTPTTSGIAGAGATSKATDGNFF